MGPDIKVITTHSTCHKYVKYTIFMVMARDSEWQYKQTHTHTINVICRF